MKKRVKYNYIIIYAILTIIGIIIVIASGTNPGEKNVRLVRNNAEDYGRGWEYLNVESDSFERCNLPLELDRSQYMDLSVRKKLGRESKDGIYLMYRSNHAENHVYIDDKEILSYGDDQDELFPLPGSAWIVIPLKDAYNGKTLEIELSRNVRKYSGRMEQVLIGDRADLLESIVIDNLFGIITCILILFVAIILLILGLFENRIFHNKNLIYLSAFSLGLFLWSINETHCTQLLYGNMEVISIMTYEILAFLSMPIIAYYSNSQYKPVRKVCKKISAIPIISFIVINVLHFLGFADLSRTLILTHITIFAVGVSIIAAHVKASFKARKLADDPPKEIGHWGFMALTLCVVIDMFRYYTANYIDASKYARIGMLIFVICLAIDTLQNAYRDEIDIKKAEVYKSVAFTDSLTGLGNRLAYEQEIERIDEREELLEHLVVGVLDLNNLKETNDSMGHAEGDRYIISNAEFVCGYFSKIANIYRIGGDEFAILFTGHDSDVYLETEADMFDDIMNSGRNDLNFAYGSAVFNHIMDRNAGDTIRRADSKMYLSKRKYKHTPGEKG